jgi:type I restriction enzyme R subunit
VARGAGSEPYGYLVSTDIHQSRRPHKAQDDAASLSEIIEILNERFGTNFTKADQLFFDQVTETAKADEDIIGKAAANSFDNFAIDVNERLLDLVIDRMDRNGEITSRLMNNPELRRVAYRVAGKIYEDARASGPLQASTRAVRVSGSVRRSLNFSLTK